MFLIKGDRRKRNKFCLTDTDMERTLVIIKKVKETPKKYPRKPGTPAKEPLGAAGENKK